MEKVYVVYKVTNTINQKIYIGFYGTKNPKDSYLGSGDKIKLAVSKYGKENFIKEILFTFNSEKEARAKEAELVDSDFIRRSDTYNLIIGGGGGDFCSGRVWINKDGKGKIIDPKELENYISLGWKTGQAVKPTKNTVYLSKDGKEIRVQPSLVQKYLNNGWVRGRTSVKNTIWIFKQDQRKRIDPTDLEKYLILGWTKGFGMSPNKGKIALFKNNKEKRIKPEKVQVYIDKGWSTTNPKSNHSKGKIWVSKNKESKRIPLIELEKYEKLGWSRGRKTHKNKMHK